MTKSHRNSILKTALGVSVSLAALSLAAPTFAADKPADTKADPNEIIVTAQFRSQKLQDTPISITAINSKLLESRSQTDISQIAGQAPNVNLTPMGAAFGSSEAVYIRGVGAYDFNPAYEQGVGLYVDDVYYATLTGNVLDLLDLDRVEVLRGPQGTLTGRNSEGGAIKLFSIKPNEKDSGYFQATYGSRNRVDLRASANFKLADGLSMRLAGVYKRQDGYVNQIDYGCAVPGNALGITANPSTGPGCVIAKLGEKNNTGIRGTLRYHPDEKLDWEIIGDYTYENRTNAAGVISASNTAKSDGIDFSCGPFCTYANFAMAAGGSVTQPYTALNTTNFTGWGVSSNLSYTFSDAFKLQSITAYRKYREIFGTDDDYTPDPNIAAAGYNNIGHHFFSQELRASGKVGSIAEWTVGGFYSDQQTVYLTRQDIRYIGHGAAFLDLQFQGNDPVNAHSEALFGTVFVHPTSGMTITGGLRYTHEHKDYNFVRQSLSGGVLNDIFGVGKLNGVQANYNNKKVDWRLSVDYRFSPEVLAYFTASTGYKGGGVDARPFTANQALNGSFSPETLTSFELGLKTDLLDRKLRVNLSTFYDKLKSIQLPIIDCSLLDGFPVGTDPIPCAATANAGDGHSYGFEAEVTASPVMGFDIDAALSYIDGKYTRIDSSVGGLVNLSDPISSPKWKWSAGAQYKADLGGAGSITPRFDVNYTGEQTIGRFSAASPLNYNPSIFLANARITWRNQKSDLAVSFEVQNVFDKYYLLPLRFAAVYSSTGTAYSNVGRPREWALSIKKNF